jgi:hypothetical protein
MIIHIRYFPLLAVLSDYLVTSVVLTKRLQLPPLSAIYHAKLFLTYLITPVVTHLVNNAALFYAVFSSPLSINFLLFTLLWSNIRNIFYSSNVVTGPPGA